MKTFSEWVRFGGITFNTKNPDYDIGVTGDYSEDNDDASHFLLPFMRKIKAFHWWCEQ